MAVCRPTTTRVPPLDRRSRSWGWLHFALYAAMVVLPQGCARIALEDHRLRTGERIGDAVSRRDSVALLFMSPADCFRCGGDLTRWMSLRRERSDAVLVLMAREPTPAEARMLTTYRISPDGLLDGRRTVALPSTPVVILYVRGARVRTLSLLDQTDGVDSLRRALGDL